MSLQVSAHPPSGTYSHQFESKAQAMFVVNRFMRAGCCCYAEPQIGSDRWWVVVERDESLRLQGYAIAAEVLHPVSTEG